MQMKHTVGQNPIAEGTELRSLLSLLDDTDTTVTTAVQNKLVSYGSSVVPALRELIIQQAELSDDGDENPSIVNARACIRALQTEALSELLEKIIDAHIDATDIDLEASVFALSRFGYPEIELKKYREKLDSIALRVHDIFIQVRNASDLTLLLSLNTVFFEQEDFRGATKNYYAPENSYICKLLDQKRGIPISISIIYMLIAERIGAELHGIGMPLHFLVYHPALNVFIDTFNHGAFISREDCEQFIRQSGFSYSDKMLKKSSNVSIVTRIMRNLIYAHSRYDQKWEAETLQETLDQILHVTDNRS